MIPKESGIYKILNIANGKLYIGSAKNLFKRKQKHFRDLVNSDHHSILLQRAFDKYKEVNFQFEVLEECQVEKLIEREQHYLDTLKPEYNICKTAGSRLGAKLSEEVKIQLSTSHTGLTNISCRKPVVQLDLKGNLIAHFDSISIASRTLEIDISSITNACTGKSKTSSNSFWLYKEVYLKGAYILPSLVSKNTGSLKPSCCKPVIQLNKITEEEIAEYRSIQEASKQTDTFELSISKACKGKIKTANGFKWKFKFAA
jgi:hypothetical protein